MKSILATLVVVPSVVAMTLASSAAPAAAQKAPQATSSAESLLHRAAYQETQKQESGKALDLYREVVKSYPDSPSAAKALERIAALETQLGDVAAANEAKTRLEALRARLAESGANEKTDGKPDSKTDARGADEKGRADRRAALAKLPPELRKRVEELRAKGVPPEEIRATIRKELAEKLRQRNLRGEIERIIADGRKKGQSPAEIRARVRKFLEEQKAKGDDADKDKAQPKKSRLV